MAKKKQRRASAPARRPVPAWFEAWSRLPARVQDGICVVFLLVVSIGFFAPVHFSGKQLVGSDTLHWQAMAKAMMDYEEATGEPALWAPNGFAGMPGYMIRYDEVVPQLDDLPAWLRQYAWPTSHFIFLLLGTFLLVVFLTGDRLAGVLAACAYGLTTYLPVILVAGHNTKFVALCFAPWLVLAFAFVLRRPKLLPALLFAAALAVNLRAGHVQITYYVAFLLGVWWLVEGVGALREGQGKRFAAATAFLAVGAVLGLLMVAQPYLANFEYKAYTIRGGAGDGAGGLDWTYAMRWSQGFAELLTLFVADAFGGAADYWGPKPFTGGPHYVGGIVLALAVLAVIRVRRRSVRAFAIAALLMTLFALGEHFPALNRLMFAYFPLFDAFRVPETWLAAVAFALAVLAGVGLHGMCKEAGPARKPYRPPEARTAYLVFGGAAALALLLFLGKDALFDYEKPGEFEQIAAQVARRNDVAADDPRVVQAVSEYLAEARARRADMMGDDAFRTFLFLVLAGGLVVAFHAGKLPAWTMQAGLVLLVTVDLAGVGRRYLNEEVLRPETDLAAQIPLLPFDQFLQAKVQEAGGPGHFRVLSLLGDPTTNARPALYYETLSGYHGAKLRLYQDFLDHILFREDGSLNQNALSMMNTRYLVGLGPLEGYRVVYRDDRFAVLENPKALPRAFFVGETEVIPSDEETFARLKDPAFDPARTALLPAPIDFETTPIDSTSTVRVELVRHTPREIVFEVETDAPRLLVVGEVYYPAGWKAEVDDAPVPIYRANHLLRAVPVPAGRHTVRMRFDPASHTVGVWVAGASTAFVYGGIVLLLGLAWRRRRASASTTAAEQEPARP
ncbi:MAG: hypothetical protein KatS3mg044_1104 [Rhodothermaceae bacterium]|nr:MAG: hypothetical protein KatS3mg044_1104 [Rhodothermaceae bacterium]